MINLYNLVPTIYSQTSRDFQFLSWLINIVLNSVKHNVDGLYDLPKADADSKLSELLAFTLGFKIRRNYDKEQLLALVNIIPKLLRYKGTAYALELAGNALIKASGAVGECKIKTDEEALKNLKNGIIEIYLPKDLIDVSLFTDLLPYILPAGMTCRFVRQAVTSSSFETAYSYQQDVVAAWYQEIKSPQDDSLQEKEVRVSKGAYGLFDAEEVPFTEFKNFSNNTKELKLNEGLVNNAVVLSVTEPFDEKLPLSNKPDENTPEGE